MIVHPDFFNHWKTKRLVRLTGDPASPIMVLKLWIYCQTQRRFEFENLPLPTLAAVCDTALPAEKLLSILLECGFVRMHENTLIVHDWDKVNRTYISAWANGKRGGRPTQPTGYRPDIRRLPIGNRLSRARIREEEENRVGSRPLTDRFSASSEPPGNLASPEEEEKPDPANIKKFGQLMKGLSQKLKAGGDEQS